jgi:hypothetical protein
LKIAIFNFKKGWPISLRRWSADKIILFVWVPIPSFLLKTVLCADGPLVNPPHILRFLAILSSELADGC